MMKCFAIASAMLLSSISLFAQQFDVSGIVKDSETGETLIGATVITGEGQGVITDIDGAFMITLPAGKHTLSAVFVGYEELKESFNLTKNTTINFALQSKVLSEVEIVADVAKARETPVAYSNITSKKIQEELGTRDMPMLLNSTPGVYATEQGGGSGDARVTIRGFDQRNVAVLVDGVPVNDMENGQVYWSNWDGLGDITRTMQVQRGLGASKLAVASVGGTINILTKCLIRQINK